MTWNPGQYLRFGGQRLRPAIDLLERIPLNTPSRVVDLGCGPGNVTALLRERWPACELTGVDNSEEMLEKAKLGYAGVRWRLQDIGAWTAEEPVDLIFSNAALHWVPDHARLLPRLVAQLQPGGVLAVQMPNNHLAASHTLLREVAAQARWANRCKGVREGATLSKERYYEILAPICRRVEIWETEYLHVLSGEDSVLEWTKGSIVLPYRVALGEEDWPAFESAYRSELRAAYPKRRDGKTLFAFRRLFLMAGVGAQKSRDDAGTWQSNV